MSFREIRLDGEVVGTECRTMKGVTYVAHDFHRADSAREEHSAEFVLAGHEALVLAEMRGLQESIRRIKYKARVARALGLHLVR